MSEQGKSFACFLSLLAEIKEFMQSKGEDASLLLVYWIKHTMPDCVGLDCYLYL